MAHELPVLYCIGNQGTAPANCSRQLLMGNMNGPSTKEVSLLAWENKKEGIIHTDLH